MKRRRKVELQLAAINVEQRRERLDLAPVARRGVRARSRALIAAIERDAAPYPDLRARVAAARTRLEREDLLGL